MRITFLQVNLPQPGLFCAPKTKPPSKNPVPPSKNPFTLLRVHSSKVFLKACPKISLLTQR